MVGCPQDIHRDGHLSLPSLLFAGPSRQCHGPARPANRRLKQPRSCQGLGQRRGGPGGEPSLNAGVRRTGLFLSAFPSDTISASISAKPSVKFKSASAPSDQTWEADRWTCSLVTRDQADGERRGCSITRLGSSWPEALQPDLSPGKRVALGPLRLLGPVPGSAH